MDNIVSLEKKFESFKDLQAYADQQYKSLQIASQRIRELEAEVAHLKDLLTGAIPLTGEHPTEQVIITPEEAICVAQIRILSDRALHKELTLEETKRLDLLVKNLNVIRNNNPSTFDGKKKPVYSDAELIAIANKKETKHD